MDPRHPEQSITRIDELMAQYKRVLDDIRSCTVSSKLGQLEREGGLVVQEICLVAPRLHEAMIQVSRTRRGMFAAGFVKEFKQVSLSGGLTEPQAPVTYSTYSASEVLDTDGEKEYTVEKPKKKTSKKKAK